MNHLTKFLEGKTPEQVISGLKSLKVSVMVNTNVGDVELYLFNYDDDAPRGQPLVEGCRGVIFEYRNGKWTCVRSSFDRFYNMGEDHSPTLPSFEEISIQEKKDGTLLMTTIYNNKIFMGTRNKFNIDDMLGLSGKNLHHVAVGLLEQFVPTIIQNPDKTFMFEFCTPWNPVVVQHEQPHLSLLGIRSNIAPYPEYDPKQFDFGMFRPTLPPTFDMKTLSECKDKVEELGGSNFEGFILKFGPIDNPSRIKLKSSTFLSLMRTGQARTSPEELLISALIDDDVEEALAIHPTWKDTIFVSVKCAMDVLNQKVETIHNEVLKLNHPSRKDLAIAAAKSPFKVFHIDHFESKEPFEAIWKRYKKDNKGKIVKYLMSVLNSS